MDPRQAILALVDAGWSQRQIAERVGVTQAAISKVKGGTQPAYDTGLKLVRLAASRRNGSRRK